MSNNGSTFTNKNAGKSFKQSLDTNLKALSSFTCSEVLIINSSGQSLLVYDNNNFTDANSLAIPNLDSIVMRGVTNSNQVSAKLASGTGDIYYRAQPYAFLIQ